MLKNKTLLSWLTVTLLVFISNLTHTMNPWSWNVWDIESQSSGEMTVFADEATYPSTPFFTSIPGNPQFCMPATESLIQTNIPGNPQWCIPVLSSIVQTNIPGNPQWCMPTQSASNNRQACVCCVPAALGTQNPASGSAGLWTRYNQFVHNAEHSVELINPLISGIVPAVQQYVEGALLFSGGEISPSQWGLASHLAGVAHALEHQLWHSVEHRLMGGDGAGGSLLRYSGVNWLMNRMNIGTYSLGRAALIVGALDFTVDAGIAFGGQGRNGLHQRFNTVYGQNVAGWSIQARAFGILLDDIPMSMVSFGVHVLSHGAAAAMLVGAERVVTNGRVPAWTRPYIANALNAFILQPIVADLSTRILTAIPGNLINPGAGTFETPFIYLYPILLLSSFFR